MTRSRAHRPGRVVRTIGGYLVAAVPPTPRDHSDRTRPERPLSRMLVRGTTSAATQAEVNMLIALLAVLGVNLIIIVVLLAFVVSRKRWVKRQSGSFRGVIRVSSGEIDG